jgi:hypothetical protein
MPFWKKLKLWRRRRNGNVSTKTKKCKISLFYGVNNKVHIKVVVLNISYYTNNTTHYV